MSGTVETHQHIPDIYLPVKKLIRNGNKYQVTETYKNLLVHKFTEYEKDFLCECYESKSESVLGITSVHGLPRLTVPGIEKRYNIPSQIFDAWLTEFKNKANNVKKRKYTRRRPLVQDPLSYLKDKPRSRSNASRLLSLAISSGHETSHSSAESEPSFLSEASDNACNYVGTAEATLGLDSFDPTNNPSHHTVIPSQPMNNPSQPMDNPSDPMDNPSHPMDNPSHPMDNPSHPVDNPSHPMSNPSHPMDNPSYHMDFPSLPMDNMINPSHPMSNSSHPMDNPSYHMDFPSLPMDNMINPSHPMGNPSHPTHQTTRHHDYPFLQHDNPSNQCGFHPPPPRDKPSHHSEYMTNQRDDSSPTLGCPNDFSDDPNMIDFYFDWLCS